LDSNQSKRTSFPGFLFPLLSSDAAIAVKGALGRNKLGVTIGAGGIFIGLRATWADTSLRRLWVGKSA